MDNKLFLRQCEFNNSVLLQEVLKLAIKKGANIISIWEDGLKPTTLVNRNIESDMKEIRIKLDNATNKTDYYYKLEQQLKELQSIEFKEYTTLHGNSYIQFELNGYVYYLQYSENPFMEENWFRKEKHNNLVTTYDCYMDNLNFYSMLNYDCYNNYTLTELQEFAKKLLDLLLTQKESKIVTKRIKMNNSCYYDDGYHWETVGEKRPKQYHIIKE